MKLKEETQAHYKKQITYSEQVYKIAKAIYEMQDNEERHKEYMYGIYVNKKNEVIQIHLESFGTVDRCAVYPREVLKQALLSDATGVFMVHNHPSGNIEPSKNDIVFTNKLKEALNILDIDLLDHIIISSDLKNYYSFTNNNKEGL